MGFNSATGRAEITAVAGQTEVDFIFKIYTDEDIVAWKTPVGQEPDDVTDLLVLHTDYEVSINGDDGGTFTLTAPATAGDAITLIRNLETSRDIEYQTNGELRPEVLNSDQNYQTYLIADQATAFDKVVRVPESSQGVGGELPAPESDAYIKWNAAANALENDTSIPQNAVDAQKSAWDSQASAMTSDSVATLFVDGVGGSNEYIVLYTSNDDGTFTATPQAGIYSSKYYEYHAHQIAGSIGALDSLTDVVVPTPIAGDALVWDDITSKWINGKVLGMPTETNHAGETVSNEGVEGDSSWRQVVSNPTNVARDETLIAQGMMVSPTIDDTFTITVPDNQVLVIL